MPPAREILMGGRLLTFVCQQYGVMRYMHLTEMKVAEYLLKSLFIDIFAVQKKTRNSDTSEKGSNWRVDERMWTER